MNGPAYSRGGNRKVASLQGARLLLTLTFLIILAHSPLSAQPTSSDTRPYAPIEFNISVQPLGAALNAFAEATGWQVSVPSELVVGLTSSGITGRHQPGAALQALLSGTGLTYRMTGTNAATLVPGVTMPGAAPSLLGEENAALPEAAGEPITPAQQKPIKVPEVMVKEAKVRDQGYTAEDASTAMRIPVPIHDIPRSVEVITRQVMEDQKVIRMSDALRNVSGVFLSQSAGGRGGEFMIRGFPTNLSVFKNGFRDDGTFGTRVPHDVINLESIEVVKGPPSYLYGRSDPGGVINQITKAPLKNPYYAAEMLFGSYNLYRPAIDVGRPLNESKSLTYRFNGLYESAESLREGVKTDRIFLAPTIG